MDSEDKGTRREGGVCPLALSLFLYRFVTCEEQVPFGNCFRPSMVPTNGSPQKNLPNQQHRPLRGVASGKGCWLKGQDVRFLWVAFGIVSKNVGFRWAELI